MAGAQELGEVGQTLLLNVRAGMTFGPVHAEMRGPAQQAVDLTGVTIRGSVRRRATDQATLTAFDVVISDAVGGRFSFGLSAAQTAALVLDRKNDPLRLYWEMSLEDSVGNKRPLFHGDFVLRLGSV